MDDFDIKLITKVHMQLKKLKQTYIQVFFHLFYNC